MKAPETINSYPPSVSHHKSPCFWDIKVHHGNQCYGNRDTHLLYLFLLFKDTAKVTTNLSRLKNGK